MKPCGLSRRERLLNPVQFKNVYQQKRAVKNTLIWLYRMPNGLAFNRLGISVSNKLCGNIVRRNKIKKIIRSIFQCNKACFGQGVDVVLVLKKKTDNIGYEQLQRIILDLSKR